MTALSIKSESNSIQCMSGERHLQTTFEFPRVVTVF